MKEGGRGALGMSVRVPIPHFLSSREFGKSRTRHTEKTKRESSEALRHTREARKSGPECDRAELGLGRTGERYVGGEEDDARHVLLLDGTPLLCNRLQIEIRMGIHLINGIFLRTVLFWSVLCLPEGKEEQDIASSESRNVQIDEKIKVRERLEDIFRSPPGISRKIRLNFMKYVGYLEEGN